MDKTFLSAGLDNDNGHRWCDCVRKRPLFVLGFILRLLPPLFGFLFSRFFPFVSRSFAPSRLSLFLLVLLFTVVPRAFILCFVLSFTFNSFRFRLD